ncbi:MAG: sugar ABC transporter permease [Clostridiaceae bacterium]|jgi:multiple sugar transport system permease protein|nr:sugar ABC transporter permease [Clostridiaceae bacterium]
MIDKNSGKYWILINDIKSWLIMLPSVILFAFFVWVPMGESIVMSLFKTKGVSLEKFVGLEQYLAVFRDPNFMAALKNTVSYTLWSLVIGFLVPIVIAVLIGETTRLRGLFRTASYLPNMMPGLATVLLWRSFFSAKPSGAFNVLISYLGMDARSWLSNAEIIIPLIVVILTWKGAGATALIYMAGLAGINPELYESATIDGAGIWRRTWHITLPQIFNLGSTLLILQIIAVFQILYEPLVLTNGGPDNASISLMQLLFNYIQNASSIDYGRASAVSVIISLMLLTFTVLYNIVNKRRESFD